MKFEYQKICKSLLKGLPQRTSNIVERRFGLKGGERETLEAIGENYGITRERVRQIIREGFSKISPKIKEYQKVFKYFNDTIKSFGDVKKEDSLLFVLGGEKSQNQVFFLLNLNKEFKRFSEDDDFHSFWTRKDASAEVAKKAISASLGKFESEKTPLAIEKLYESQKLEIEKALNKKINKGILSSYLEISKKIQKNPEEQFGLRNWLEINPRGIKDKAYLVLKKEGKPLHFTQITNFIEKLPFLAKRKAHLATVHNELIKDPRFVLVGRGLYALKDWGYEPGVVKDIIYKVIKDADHPVSKEEILEKVSKQRFVKANTILLNLQDKNCFLRDEEGKYKINSVKES